MSVLLSIFLNLLCSFPLHCKTISILFFSVYFTLLITIFHIIISALGFVWLQLSLIIHTSLGVSTEAAVKTFCL